MPDQALSGGALVLMKQAWPSTTDSLSLWPPGFPWAPSTFVCSRGRMRYIDDPRATACGGSLSLGLHLRAAVEIPSLVLLHVWAMGQRSSW